MSRHGFLRRRSPAGSAPPIAPLRSPRSPARRGCYAAPFRVSFVQLGGRRTPSGRLPCRTRSRCRLPRRCRAGRARAGPVVAERAASSCSARYPLRPALAAGAGLPAVRVALRGQRSCVPGGRCWLLALWIAVPAAAIVLLRGGCAGARRCAKRLWGGLPLTFLLSTCRLRRGDPAGGARSRSAVARRCRRSARSASPTSS